MKVPSLITCSIPEVGSAVLSAQLGASVDDVVTNPEKFIRSMNVYRRHLSAEQKREAIAARIKADPQASNHTIAKAEYVDDKTVAKVRKESVPKSDSPKMEHRPIERAKAAARENPDASVSEIARREMWGELLRKKHRSSFPLNQTHRRNRSQSRKPVPLSKR